MSTLKWAIVIALVGYGGLLALAYVFQRALMYFPDTKRTPPAAAGLLQAEELVLTSADGETLIAWHVAARDERPVLLYFPGNGGGLDLRVERFRALIADGTGLIALAYRGYGGSSGKPSEPGLIRDALAVYDFAAARYPTCRIVPFGESLGSAVAVALAALRPVGGVILDAPFTSAAAVGAAAYPFLPVRSLIRDSFRSDRRIGSVRAPLLVLHGARDKVVPIRFGERLFALAHAPKRMVRFPSGGHGDLDSYGALDAVKEFLAGLQ